MAIPYLSNNFFHPKCKGLKNLDLKDKRVVVVGGGQTGSEIYLPQINNESSVMKFSKLEDKSKLIKNYFGISEALGTKEIMPEYLDLILLPCVCFDKLGYRIGMGKGYYDYSLEKLSRETNKIFILAHEFQKVDNCFPENHDIKAQGCITDSEFYIF